MSSHPTSQITDDYRLIRLLSETESSRVWLAEQSSIARSVLVEELRPERAERREDFLADARAKAAVDHPLVATVYEAVADESRCFFARECLTAHTLLELLQAGGSLTPARLAHILRLVAEAQIHLESAGQATAAVGLDHIHVDDHDVVRLDNLAVAGSRDPGQSARDIAALGVALRPLVAAARPGTTRMLTLLSWMRGEEIDCRLDWRQVVEVCNQIEQQLGRHASAPKPTEPIKKRRRSVSKTVVAALMVPCLALVFWLAWQLRPQDRENSPPTPALQAVVVGAGRHPSPDGTEHSMAAFRIAAREVTVAEYREFLGVLETLAESGLERSFDHREQPAEKTSHLPDHWSQQTAKPGHMPVTGIDWWDAAAYAAWKKGRLPTQEQWYAAVIGKRHVMSGSPAINQTVREWTLDPAADPANPLAGAKWVIVRRTDPETGRIAREWVDDRSLRFPDVGFRVCFAIE